MTNYDPTPQVLINGVSNTDIIIESISINMGRSDITSQPQPGYASVSLYIDAAASYGVQPMDTLQVKLNDSTGSYVSLFNGYISDVSVALAMYGAGSGLIQYSMTATGPLANLHRKTAGGANYSLQNDGDRILAILKDAYLTNWTDVAPDLNWNELPSGTTWNSFDGVNNDLVTSLTSTITTPGQYTLDQYNSGETDAYELCVSAANSGRGILTEGGDGKIYYYDFLSRNGLTPIAITTSDLSASQFAFNAQLGEIVNEVTVTYGSSAETVARDEQSIYKYGQLQGSKATTLHNASEADSQAVAYLASRAYARTYPEALLFELENPNITDALRNSLISISNLNRFSITELPIAFGTTFDGFVENWSWQFSRNRAALSVGCSARTETYANTVWLQEPVSVLWNNYLATTKWSDVI